MSGQAEIFVAGHRGLVGSAISRLSEAEGVSGSCYARVRSLTCWTRAVDSFFATERPEYVFLAAAKVGGILANNTYPADFIRDNLNSEQMSSKRVGRKGVKRLLFLGSSCIYPRLAPQPIREEYLLTGPLEPTNRPYALAKIAGIEMCWSYNRQYATQYLAAMPTNLYGPHDNFDLRTSHVLPALLRKGAHGDGAGQDTSRYGARERLDASFCIQRGRRRRASFCWSLRRRGLMRCCGTMRRRW